MVPHWRRLACNLSENGLIRVSKGSFGQIEFVLSWFRFCASFHSSALENLESGVRRAIPVVHGTHGEPSVAGLQESSPCVIVNELCKNELDKKGSGLKWEVLRPGMILLKEYLNLTKQVEVVRICEQLGRGRGGFFQPTFRTGNKIHLKMMCLGRHWDFETGFYMDRRPFDSAMPPDVPDELKSLALGAMHTSHNVLTRCFGTRKAKKILPEMLPEICIVNFYCTSGKLGLHQDKDESRDSLEKGLSVVSVSVGDSAVFLYAMNRGEAKQKPRRVVLGSGDVLIFGGPSRLVHYGISEVLPNTAPRQLVEQTGLSNGRLNLTFRQF